LHFDVQFDDKLFRDKTIENVEQSSVSVLLVAELTNRCNLRCGHCYADAHPKAVDSLFMNRERWKRVFEWGWCEGYRCLQLIGGEPTLHRHFPELLLFGRQLGFDIEVFSNGVSVGKKVREALAHVRPRMAFSLYSSDPEVHDGVTEVAGSLKRTLDTIKWCADEGLKVRVAVIGVCADQSEFERMRQCLDKLGVSKVSFHGVQPVGRARYLGLGLDENNKLCGVCGKGMLCVDASGNVKRCVFSRTNNLGRIGEGKYKEILAS
jgi:MoaA/NifB/PqqE/SkfB family radical SAM enzyme